MLVGHPLILKRGAMADLNMLLRTLFLIQIQRVYTRSTKHDRRSNLLSCFLVTGLLVLLPPRSPHSSRYSFYSLVSITKPSILNQNNRSTSTSISSQSQLRVPASYNRSIRPQSASRTRPENCLQSCRPFRTLRQFSHFAHSQGISLYPAPQRRGSATVPNQHSRTSVEILRHRALYTTQNGHLPHPKMRASDWLRGSNTAKASIEFLNLIVSSFGFRV